MFIDIKKQQYKYSFQLFYITAIFQCKFNKNDHLVFNYSELIYPYKTARDKQPSETSHF